MRRSLLALALGAWVVLAACAASSTSIGPLTMKVPEGWQVSDREGTNLKITNGTIAAPDATKAGTATAVFDIYVDSPQTPQTFLAFLRQQKITPQRDHRRIGGYDVEVFGYEDRSGRQEAVFVPRWKIFILYRAAFRGDDAAFLRGRAAFRRAVDSMTFSGSGSGSALGSDRHGPTFGKIARTAIAAPVAISTNPS